MDAETYGFVALNVMRRVLEGSAAAEVEVAALLAGPTSAGAPPPPAPVDSRSCTTWLGDADDERLASTAPVARYAGQAVLLRKRPGTPFPALITVGRSARCDVVLELPTVSKIHAYFVRGARRWELVDQHSMNKTFVNGRELVPGWRDRLASGDRIRFGHEEELLFLEPKDLLARTAALSGEAR